MGRRCPIGSKQRASLRSSTARGGTSPNNTEGANPSKEPDSVRLRRGAEVSTASFWGCFTSSLTSRVNMERYDFSSGWKFLKAPEWELVAAPAELCPKEWDGRLARRSRNGKDRRDARPTLLPPRSLGVVWSLPVQLSSERRAACLLACGNALGKYIPMGVRTSLPTRTSAPMNHFPRARRSLPREQ